MSRWDQADQMSEAEVEHTYFKAGICMVCGCKLVTQGEVTACPNCLPELFRESAAGDNS